MPRNPTTQPEPKVPSARVVYAAVARAPKLISIADVVALTGFSRRSVQGWVSHGLLRTIKVGRRRIISRDELLRFLNDRIEAGYLADTDRRVAMTSKDARDNAIARAARETLSIEIDVQLDADVFVPMVDLRHALERAYTFGKRDAAGDRLPERRAVEAREGAA